MGSFLDVGAALDRRWRLMRGEPPADKKDDLLLIARILGDSGTPYAVIGGVALQFHHEDPRTTLDIDLAVQSWQDLPVSELHRAGFSETGRFEHSRNWVAPGGTPVQFTADPLMRPGITRARAVVIEGVSVAIFSASDLMRAKLVAAADPARRRSKRIQDLADVEALIEQTPELRDQLTKDEQALLDSLLR